MCEALGEEFCFNVEYSGLVKKKSLNKIMKGLAKERGNLNKLKADWFKSLFNTFYG